MSLNLDKVLDLQHEVDLLRKRVEKLERKTLRQSIIIFVQTGAILGLIGVTGWLANHLYDCLTAAGKMAHL